MDTYKPIHSRNHTHIQTTRHIHEDYTNANSGVETELNNAKNVFRSA